MYRDRDQPSLKPQINVLSDPEHSQKFLQRIGAKIKDLEKSKVSSRFSFYSLTHMEI